MDDDILNEFLVESREGLDQLDVDFVVLENNPQDKDTLASVFRTIHTIKGTCGFFGLTALEKITHAGENLLVMLRDGVMVLDESTTSLLLEMVDAVREQLETIAETGSEKTGDYHSIVNRLEQTTLECTMRAANKNTQSNNDPCADSDNMNHVEVDTEYSADGDTESVALDDEMMEVVKEFLQESNENLDQVDSELVELEEDPENRDLISSIFRSIHTIKGTCGFFAFSNLEKVTHVGESLLVKLRDGECRMTEDIASALLGMVDAVRAMLDEISENGSDGKNGYSKLISTLVELVENGVLQRIEDKNTDSADAKLNANSAESLDEGVIVPSDKVPPGVSESILDGKASTEPQNQKAIAKPETELGRKKIPANVVEASIRVDVPVLDSLMNLVGELVLARNQIGELVGTHENTQVIAATQRLNLITSELQEAVMQTRMQPIHSVWAKLPRVVRDLSRSCGKKIRVEMEGKSTELDKSLIEAMKDPLTHLVRNSVDHGIEQPEERIAAGKPEEGVLTLRAFHEGGQVHIEISDDGKGINTDRIKQKAIDNGLITIDHASTMTEKDICRLIFLPGLSTAEQVTNISGRGVGMDVVKTNIERINGTIDLDTKQGRGSIFKIKVPLTLAIVPALIVSTASQRFAIPQVNLIELLRIDEEDQENAIEYIQECPVYRLRGRLLPLVHLGNELRMDSQREGVLNIVVLQSEKNRYGLIVEHINDTQEIVVKPLTDALKNISVFSGATIMGDGRVALILDPHGIGHRAGVLGDNRNNDLAMQPGNDINNSGNRQTLLLVRTDDGGRLAIQLDKVARLEQFEKECIEYAGSSEVVQYRGQILPLVPVCEILEERRDVARHNQENTDKESAAPIQVVVFGKEGCQVGLVVGEIVDIVNESIKVRSKSSRHGVLETATIQGKVTELLDVSIFLQRSESLAEAAREVA
ncbi:MAG: chemotaxis protein CheA [Granulosicoccus sp.]